MPLPYILTRDGRRVEIPDRIKERPKHRDQIRRICEGYGWSIEELYVRVQVGCLPFQFGPAYVAQLRIMRFEEWCESERART